MKKNEIIMERRNTWGKKRKRKKKQFVETIDQIDMKLVFFFLMAYQPPWFI